MACANAEEGNKAEALTNIQRAFARKANIISGERMPDPSADLSFEKYRNGPDFIALMTKLGYK